MVSIRFHTNIQMNGLSSAFQTEAMTFRCSERSSNAVLGLQSVQIHTECESDGENEQKKKRIAVGPWGGNGGAAWDDGGYNGVREIVLSHGRCIDSIRVVYDKNGKPFSGEKHGGVGGNRTTEIKLQFPEEILICVSGHIAPVVHGMSPVIRSFTFKTNKRIYGPYGVEEGMPFSLPVEGGLIVGFKGRSGWYLDAVGFHLSPVQTAKVLDRVQQRLRRLTGSVY